MGSTLYIQHLKARMDTDTRRLENAWIQPVLRPIRQYSVTASLPQNPKQAPESPLVAAARNRKLTGSLYIANAFKM
jgi:hypothetical protein